mmetsp:Transcript_8800/g.19010  ORF Transcript_8800/g.19010 Transcript_8800/m.19010 type:complete len:372 (+) Transcript_8800:254-1369(+)
MALVNVVNMVVLDNPTCFTSPFQFEITFECLQELDDDLEWKVLYVGSAQDAAKDQILDEILVGPVPVGVNKFVLQADAPDPSQLAQDDLLGVTVVLVTCSYKEREFVRVGYYVNNEYEYNDPNANAAAQAAAVVNGNNNDGAEQQQQPPPAVTIPNPVPLERIQRQILADKPRVTKFPISWGDEPQQQQNQQQHNQQQQHCEQNQQHMQQTNFSNNNMVAAAAGSSLGAAMMADHAAAASPTTSAADTTTRNGSAAMLPPPGGGAPTISNDNSIDSNNNSTNNNNNDTTTAAVDMTMMQEEEENMEEEDIMEEEELSVDSESGEQVGDGIVSMPEESNMSHAYFGNSNQQQQHSSNNNNNTNSSNVQAMTE